MKVKDGCRVQVCVERTARFRHLGAECLRASCDRRVAQEHPHAGGTRGRLNVRPPRAQFQTHRIFDGSERRTDPCGGIRTHPGRACVPGENLLLRSKRSSCSEAGGQAEVSQVSVQLDEESYRAAPPADRCPALDSTKRTEGIAEDIRGRQ
jgi:hypothetical protein